MKKALIAGILIMIFLVSGCAIQEYLQGYDTNKSYSLLTEKDDFVEGDQELDKLIEELSQEDNVDETPIVDETEVVEETPIVEEETDNSVIKITVKENDLVRLKPKAVDADEDEIIYTFSEPLDSNGEWQTSYGDAGNYLITVTASDGKLVTEKKVMLNVERVNVAPIIEGVDSVIETQEGETLELNLDVSDPNGDLIDVEISEPVGNDGVWDIGYQENGNYDLVIRATDGELETIKEIELIVKKTNVAPEIEDLDDIEIDEGDVVEINPVVSDLNGDDIVVSISEPIGDDGVWETGYTSHGVYEITVEATDGTATSTKTFTLIINDVNKAPEIIDITTG